MNLKDILFRNISKINPPAFGLDLSDYSIKVAQLKKKGKIFELKNYNRVSIPEGVIEGGMIKKKDKLIEIIKKSINTVKGESIKTSYVVCSLPEQHGFIKIIQLPMMTLEEANKAIKWEAEANIPLSLEEVYLSWQIIPSQKSSEHLDVLIAAVPKNLADKYLEVFRAANIEPIVFEIESVATARSLIKNEFSSKSILIIDLGYSRTSFIIFAGNSIRFTSSISSVSNKEMLESIGEKLNVTLKEAQLSKFKIGLDKKGRIFNALLPFMTKLIEKINDCIAFHKDYSQQDKECEGDISEIILCGGGAHLKGLPEYLSSRLKIPVKLGNPWINIPYSKKKLPIIPFNESPAYATVLGLALRGAEIK
ncbi:MAG: type IV pilus assembly protein PilM [Patescibacteria group bacterium]